MSLNVLASTLGTVATQEGEGHFPPTPEIFWTPLFTIGPVSVTRPMVVVALSVALIAWWLLATTKRAAVVPTKGQFLAEGVYGFVRNGIAKDMIGFAPGVMTTRSDPTVTPRRLEKSAATASRNAGDRSRSCPEGPARGQRRPGVLRDRPLTRSPPDVLRMRPAGPVRARGCLRAAT